MGPKRKCARETRLQFEARQRGRRLLLVIPKSQVIFHINLSPERGAQKRICRQLSDRPNLQTYKHMNCYTAQNSVQILCIRQKINRLLWFSLLSELQNKLYLPCLLQIFPQCTWDYNCDYKLNSDAKWTWQLPFNQAHFKQVILLHLTVYCCCFSSYYCCCCCCYSCAFCAFLLTDQFNRLSTKFHRKIIALCTQPANSQKTKNTKKSN